MSPVHPDPAPCLAVLREGLARVGRHVDEGEFEAGLALCRSLLARPDDAGDAEALGLRSMLHVRLAGCLIKLERFEPAIAEMRPMLDRLSAQPPSAVRAELLVRMAFAQLQLSHYEASMRAAHVALHDALSLDDTLLAAQALERIAMAAMNLGDPLMAERFMLEALGFFEQARDATHLLRAASNALFMCCSLHDSLRDRGEAELASALLQRARRVVAASAGLLEPPPSLYLACLWRANHARWLLRRGLGAEAEAQMRAIHAEASGRAWHPIRRPLNLELAALHEERGELAQAAALLQDVFEPAGAPPRHRQARKALARLQRVCLAMGDEGRAVHYGALLSDLASRMAEEARRASSHLQDLSDLSSAMLAEADQRRLEDEIARLREDRKASHAVDSAY